MQINKGTNTIGSFDKKQKDTTNIISTVTAYKIEAKLPVGTYELLLWTDWATRCGVPSFLLIWTITAVYPIARMMCKNKFH